MSDLVIAYGIMLPFYAAACLSAAAAETLYSPDMCYALADSGVSVLSAEYQYLFYDDAAVYRILHSAILYAVSVWNLADRISYHIGGSDYFPYPFQPETEEIFRSGSRSGIERNLGRRKEEVGT